MRLTTILCVRTGMALISILSFSSTPASSVRQRQFEFVYEVSIKEIPSQAHQLRVWTPLAKSDTYQKILDRRIELTYPYHIDEDPEYGNQILVLELEKSLPEEVRFQINYQVISMGGEVELSENPSGEAPELHLKSNRLMVVNDDIRRLSREITRGQKTVLEKARAIYDYVIGFMKYDKAIEGWGNGDTLRACVVGAGNCTDFHSLFISLARASGIPARFKIGAEIPASDPEGSIGYHCWAEFCCNGKWIPVDASQAWKHPEKRDYYFGAVDENKFFVSSGRDIRLAEGKTANIFIYPYVEVDGKPFQSVEAQFYFRNVNLKEG